MQEVDLQCTSPIIGEVKYAANIGNTHDPCGTLISMGLSSSLLPSRHMEVFHSWRNECTHHVMGSGMWYEQSVLRRCKCGIVLKNPVMSNVRIEAFCLWFQAISMSCTVHSNVSSANLPGIPPIVRMGISYVWQQYMPVSYLEPILVLYQGPPVVG